MYITSYMYLMYLQNLTHVCIGRYLYRQLFMTNEYMSQVPPGLVEYLGTLPLVSS